MSQPLGSPALPWPPPPVLRASVPGASKQREPEGKRTQLHPHAGLTAPRTVSGELPIAVATLLQGRAAEAPLTRVSPIGMKENWSEEFLQTASGRVGLAILQVLFPQFPPLFSYLWLGLPSSWPKTSPVGIPKTG